MRKQQLLQKKRLCKMVNILLLHYVKKNLAFLFYFLFLPNKLVTVDTNVKFFNGVTKY